MVAAAGHQTVTGGYQYPERVSDEPGRLKGLIAPHSQQGEGQRGEGLTMEQGADPVQDAVTHFVLAHERQLFHL